MFNTITEDSKNPMIVYTREELLKLKDQSEELVRTRFRTLDKSINTVYSPGKLLVDAHLKENSKKNLDQEGQK